MFELFGVGYWVDFKLLKFMVKANLFMLCIRFQKKTWSYFRKSN